MTPAPSATQIRVNNITTCLTAAVNTLETLAISLETPFLEAISNTTRSLLKNIQNIKHSKNECIQFLEQTHELLGAIITVHMESDTGVELPPNIINHIGELMDTLHKINTFVEIQQNGSKVKRLFRQQEMQSLLQDCKTKLQRELDFFQIRTISVATDITQLQQDAQKRHQEVLDMLEKFSDITSSDGTSSIGNVYSRSHNSSNSISMLPSEPKIFHGRQSELTDILKLFRQEIPRIAILGAGGMGKTSLSRAALHHPEITSRFGQYRYFIPTDSAATRVELAALIGAHLGLKPGKDLTHTIVQHFSRAPPSLLILDNVETSWEPEQSRGDIENFMSLLTGIDHLALMITMRGAERPAAVRWTRPFLPPLDRLDQDAAQQTFIDIADSSHDPEDVDKILALTDNMPLAINLLAHLVDSEGCSSVLSHWAKEKTSLVSEGYDRRSNLDLSISLSLSSPRLQSVPQSRKLLSLLSMLPDGLSDAELIQSRLPIDDILGCKAALIRTTLAYSDEHKRLKVLVPIREYMQTTQPPCHNLIQPLLKFFQELLQFFAKYRETQVVSRTVAQILSNYTNIQNVLQNALRHHPDLINSIYLVFHLNKFSQHVGRGFIPWIQEIKSFFPKPCDHRLEVYFIINMLDTYQYYRISDPETLLSHALEHFNHFDDPDLKCTLYSIVGLFYKNYKRDLRTAITFFQTAMTLAISTGNTKEHSYALGCVALAKWSNGDPTGALIDAYECQRLARISGLLMHEARAIRIQVTCKIALGDYTQTIFLCKEARNLLHLCGLSGGYMDHATMTCQGDIHNVKSEYIEARNIHTQILHEVSADGDLSHYGWASLNIAETNMSMGAPCDEVERTLETARKLFSTIGHINAITMCDTVLARLYLRDGHIPAARALFENCLKISWGNEPQIISPCLESLANGSHWDAVDWMSVSGWTTVFLVHSLKFHQKLEIYKALQFLGDIFLTQDDETTAISLFSVALDGFTQMDVHRSRAECMLRFGDISKRHGKLLNAVELWGKARPLFERSSQSKQVQNIDDRLAGVGQDVLQQHQNNLARLAEPNVPLWPAVEEEAKDNPSDIEDMENMNSVEHKELNLVTG